MSTAAFAGLAALVGCAVPEDAQPSGTATRSSSPSVGYADGDYTALGEYGGLPSHITVSLTLSDNIVTAVDVTPHATDPTSLDYQERFADAIDAVVVGKPIADLEISKIAGSSGTPDGFNDALEQIRTQAAS